MAARRRALGREGVRQGAWVCGQTLVLGLLRVRVDGEIFWKGHV